MAASCGLTHARLRSWIVGNQIKVWASPRRCDSYSSYDMSIAMDFWTLLKKSCLEFPSWWLRSVLQITKDCQPPKGFSDKIYALSSFLNQPNWWVGSFKTFQVFFTVNLEPVWDYQQSNLVSANCIVLELQPCLDFPSLPCAVDE